MHKKIISVIAILLCIIVVAQLSGCVKVNADGTWLDTATQAEVTAKIYSLQETYPEGMTWTNKEPGSAYIWMVPGSIIAMSGCAAFAAIIQDSVFGTLTEAPVQWQRITVACPIRGIDECDVPYSWATLWPGDILVFNGHTVIVTQKYDDHISIAEGNVCGQVRWGRTITKEGVETAKYVYTRYAKTEPLMFYNDLPDSSDWAWEAVAWGLLNRYADPVTESSFKPWKECTRAEMITFLWHVCGSHEPAYQRCPFEDVADDAPYSKAVRWAYEQGYTAGITETTFSPDEICNRAQVITFLWRLSGSELPRGTETEFTDIQSHRYYYRAVLWATEQGLAKGTSNTTFAPNASCTRAEALMFLCRAVKAGLFDN